MPSENTIYLAAIISVSALLGYLFLKFVDKDDNESKISPEYLTGLKLLLNEQADKAINLFSEIVQVDEETIETHLALGVLFRKQGKIDQAIKLHENIISKKELKEHHYYQTLEELAEDYYTAGLYDKSEEIFKKLIDIKNHKNSSLGKLIQIYEYTCEWDKALSTIEKLNSISIPQMNIKKIFLNTYAKYLRSALLKMIWKKQNYISIKQKLQNPVLQEYFLYQFRLR